MAGEESFFTQGRLEMSAVPLPEPQSLASWGELLPNRIGIVISIVLVLLNLKDIIRLFPTLVYALDRVRGSIALEYNVSKARMRNDIALVLALPFCLLLDRYALYRPQFWVWISPAWSSLATIGAVLAFIALRRLCHLAVHIPRLGQDSDSALVHSLYNFFIALCFVILPLVGILSVFSLNDSTIRLVILSGTGLAYLLSLTGEVKIFLNAGHSALRTILYLCALEILPAAAVVASAVLL